MTIFAVDKLGEKVWFLSQKVAMFAIQKIKSKKTLINEILNALCIANVRL